MKLTKEMLIDWIDRPPSNSDLDFINKIIELENNRDKALEYLNQPYRDNFDYSKAQLINILGSDE